MYVNGMLENTNTTTTRGINRQPLLIGNQPFFGPRLLNGLIDEPSVYIRALTDFEIQTIYNAGSAGKCLTPTAASVLIGGRLLNANGRGIASARVRLTEADGSVRTVLTGAFGYYRFADVTAGQTVFLEVFSKRFAFANAVRMINVNGQITDADFVASP